VAGHTLGEAGELERELAVEADPLLRGSGISVFALPSTVPWPARTETVNGTNMFPNCTKTPPLKYDS
jgi:hypothetical protein